MRSVSRPLSSREVALTPAGQPQSSTRDTFRAIFNYPEPGVTLRGTAWLDGLRGLAAFEVFVFHYCDGWLDRSLAWGHGDFRDPSWYRLPIIRTFYASGDTAVCVFFAISGYVLSHKMLSLLRQRRHDELYSSLSSAVFRRGIRLYMPVIILSFTLMVVCRLFGLPKPSGYESAPTFFLELHRWSWSIVHLLLPLRYPDRWQEILNVYDGNISWTIPLEYYGSLIIYVAVLLFSRTRSMSVRLSITFALVVSSFLQDDWMGAQFLMGMAFADYQLEKEMRPRLQDGAPRRWPRALFVLAIFLFGFYLAGLTPAHFLDSSRHRLWPRPFYDWFSIPLSAMGLYADRQGDRFIECIAGMCLVVGVGETPRLKRLMETRFVQYFGKISFGLYLCHPFLHAWLRPLDKHYFALVGLDHTIPPPEREESLRLFLAYCFMLVPSIAVNFIVGGLFERFVDRPSIRTAKTFEQWCLSKGFEPSDPEAAAPMPRRTETSA